MIKEIDFPPYTRAEILRIEEDGSVACNLYGEGYSDSNIAFPPESTVLQLTRDEQVILSRVQPTLCPQ